MRDLTAQERRWLQAAREKRDLPPYQHHGPRFELPKRDAPSVRQPNKLTDADREEVRAMYADGATIVEVHERFPNVTRTHLRNVAKGRKHVKVKCALCPRVRQVKKGTPGPHYCTEHQPPKRCPCNEADLNPGAKLCLKCSRLKHTEDVRARQARLKAEAA